MSGKDGKQRYSTTHPLDDRRWRLLATNGEVARLVELRLAGLLVGPANANVRRVQVHHALTL